MIGDSGYLGSQADIEMNAAAAAARKMDAHTDMPGDVKTMEALEELPIAFHSGDARRPLRSQDVDGNEYKHALRPMMYSVLFVLVVEGLERLSFYGINFTQQAYLTGAYDKNWTAGLGTVEAGSWVQISTAIAYSTPFVGAFLADVLIGNYWTILVGACMFYLPGLLIIALTAYPQLLSETFPTAVLAAGLLGFYPVGAGLIKSCVNVFGAQQFHPILQRDMIEQYYVRFYMTINIGALVGGITIPIVTQTDVFAAYMIPVAGLALAVLTFLSATSRYVRMAPQGRVMVQSLRACGGSVRHCPPSLERTKVSRGGWLDDPFVDNVKLLMAVVPTTALIIPFNVAYSQMSNTFITQGTVMKPLSFIDASWMQNFDAFSVLFSGAMLTFVVDPMLKKRGIKLHLATKFALGTGLGAVALLCAVIVDYQIHSQFAATGEPISVLWQSFSFFFIGAGEIFAISSAYEAAFLVAPPEQKALASAINLFLIGAVPSFISTGVLNACKKMAFTNDEGTTDLGTLEKYTQASVYKYFWVLFGIALFGVVLNVLPPVRRFLTTIEIKALEASAKNTAAGEDSGLHADVKEVDVLPEQEDDECK